MKNTDWRRDRVGTRVARGVQRVRKDRRLALDERFRPRHQALGGGGNTSWV